MFGIRGLQSCDAVRNANHYPREVVPESRRHFRITNIEPAAIGGRRFRERFGWGGAPTGVARDGMACLASWTSNLRRGFGPEPTRTAPSST